MQMPLPASDSVVGVDMNQVTDTEMESEMVSVIKFETESEVDLAVDADVAK